MNDTSGRKTQIKNAYFVYTNREKQTAEIRRILVKTSLQKLKPTEENAAKQAQ